MKLLLSSLLGSIILLSNVSADMTQQEIVQYTQGKYKASNFSFSPDGRYLIARRANEGSISYVYDSQKKKAFDINHYDSRGGAVDSQSKYLVLSNFDDVRHKDSRTIIVELATGKIHDVESNVYMKAIFSPSGKYLALPMERYNRIEFYDIAAMKSLGTVDLDNGERFDEAHWVSDDAIILGTTQKIRVHAVPSLEVVRDFKTMNLGSLYRGRLSVDRRYYVYALQTRRPPVKGSLNMLDTKTWKEKTIISTRSSDYAISPDSKKIYYTDDKSSTFTYDVATGKITEKKWKGQIWRIHYASSGEEYIICVNGASYYCNNKTGEQTKLSSRVDDFTIVHSPYGPYVGYKNSNSESFIYNKKTKKYRKLKQKKLGSSPCFIFMPDGKHVAFTGDDSGKILFYTLP